MHASIIDKINWTVSQRWLDAMKSFIEVSATILLDSIQRLKTLAGMVDLCRFMFKDKTQSSKGQNHNLQYMAMH